MAILDSYTPTGAWSLSRDLLSSWTDPRYTETSGALSAIADQSGNGRNFTQGTSSSRPVLSTYGFNNRECAVFDGTNDNMTSVAVSNLIAAGAGYIIASFVCDGGAATSGTRYNNAAPFMDSSGYVGLPLGVSGESEPYSIAAFNYSGGSQYAITPAILELGNVYVAEWLHTGGVLYGRINKGVWYNVSSGNTSSLSGTFRIGRGNSAYLNGKLFEIATFSDIPSSGDQDLIAQDFIDWAIGIAEPQDVHVTQLLAAIVELSNQPAQITQLPVIIVSLPVQPARATQLLAAPVVHYREVPFPNVIVPELPVNETWEWFSAVSIKDNGKEQRSLLREAPRRRMSFSAITLNDTDRREAYDLLWKYQGREFLYPSYQYGAFLESATQGATQLYFNPKLTDIRSGETAALFDSHTGLTHYVACDQIQVDGVTLVDPLPFDVSRSWQICPATQFRLVSPGTLAVGGVDGTMTVTMESVGHRALQRVDSSSLLTVYDGYIVLDKRPVPVVSSEYSRNVSWVDSGTGLPLPETKWRMNFSTDKRSFNFNRYQDTDYWRAFADLVKGRQKVFIHPTFFDDLPLNQQPGLGDTQLITTNIQADEYLSGRLNRYIRVESEAGVIFRRINYHELVYDSNGDPVAVRLVLNSSIGSTSGSNVIKKISFAPLTRLNSDSVSLTHGSIDTTITLDMRTVNE